MFADLFELENYQAYRGEGRLLFRNSGVSENDESARLNDLPYLLARAHRHMNGALSDALKPKDLPVEQWRILAALADEEGRAIGTLCDQVLMNFSGLSKTIDRMVSRALVHRKQDEQDNRRVLVYITDFGLELYRSCQADLTNKALDAGVALNRRESEQLQQLLRRLSPLG